VQKYINKIQQTSVLKKRKNVTTNPYFYTTTYLRSFRYTGHFC